MKVFASHNPDAQIRSESSSGGIFSMLAEDILSHNGVVYGVGFDSNWDTTYKRITTTDELIAIRGSKYSFTSIGSVLSLITQDLADGKEVLVSGSPCQIAAVRQRHGNNDKLLLVEIVCHSAPEPRFWKTYLTEICRHRGRSISDIKGIRFRNKRLGWKTYSLVINFKKGRDFRQRYDDNCYQRAFLFGYTVRPACFNCRFKYPDGTRADITLGDLWGITEMAPQIDNDLGTTLVIARTEKGEQTVDKLPVDAIIDINEAAKHNPAIFKASRKPERFDEFRKAVETDKRLIPVLKKFANRPFSVQLKLDFARFKYRTILKVHQLLK